MNWKIWKKEEKRSLSDTPGYHPGEEVMYYHYGENKGVVHVTSSSLAMKIATFYRCMAILSGTVASLPIQVKVKRNGYWVVDEESSLAYVLQLRANKKHTAFDMIRNAIIQMVCDGNAYIFPEYDNKGDLSELILLSKGCTSYDPLTNIYHVCDFANKVNGVFDASEIIHLRNMSLDGGDIGVSTITYASKVLSISATADEKSLDVYSPGGTKSGFVAGEGSITKGVGGVQDAAIKTVSETIAKEIASGKKIFNLPAGFTFNELGLSPADTELLKSKEFGVFEICRFMGVHPDKVFAGQSQNYKASEMSQVLFMSDTLNQILTQIAQEFTVKLISRNLFGKMKMEFDIEDFYKTDLTTLATFTEKNISTTVWTPNEARKKRGMPGIEGGDEPMISCNVAPLNSEKIRGGKEKVLPKNEIE